MQDEKRTPQAPPAPPNPPKPPKPSLKHKLHKKGRFAGPLVMLFLLVCMMLPPAAMAGPMAAATGWPMLVAALVAGAGWLLVVYLLLWLLLFAVRRQRKKLMESDPRNMFDDALEALDRLAQGDYDVFIEGDERYHYSELGDKINNLAKQLSSMEQMRQDFVSNVSHEIQSPLTSIAGFAQLLRKEDLTREERLHYIDVIQSETARMSKMSDSLLRLSVLDSEVTDLNLLPFRLDKQIESVLLALEPQWAAKRLELEIELVPTTCTCDEELLLQVWQNLIQNAIKFTPEEGHVHVRLWQEDDTVFCSVSDDGIGIPPEDLVHIFERFYKVDKARDRKMGGNGLGLALCKRIVELHDGQVQVESAPGGGTTFVVALPCGAMAEKNTD